MDKNLTQQLKLRNDDCESQLISHHYHKGREYVPIYRKSEYFMKHSEKRDLLDSESKQPFSIAESDRSQITGVMNSKEQFFANISNEKRIEQPREQHSKQNSIAPSSLNSFLFGPGKNRAPSQIFDEKGLTEKITQRHTT